MTQPKLTALNMELEPYSSTPARYDDVSQPLEALVIVRGLDSDGKAATWLLRTHGLDPMTAIGMAHWARAVATG